VIFLDLRIDQLLEMRLKAFIGAFFVSADQARIAGHIGGEDCCETARRRELAARHRCDKAVAAPCDRLDAAPLCSPVIEDPAQRCDLDVEVAVFDRRPRPDGVYDVGSRDEIPRPLDQHAENVEGARADRHRSEHTPRIPPVQNTTTPVEAETLE
jgi:hypothetical protein